MGRAQVVGKQKAHEILKWTHLMFPNLKRWAAGVCHGLRRKHVQRYMDEFVFRCSRRRHTRTAFERLLGIGLQLKPATCRDFVDGRVWRAGTDARTPSCTPSAARIRPAFPGIAPAVPPPVPFLHRRLRFALGFPDRPLTDPPQHIEAPAAKR